MRSIRMLAALVPLVALASPAAATGGRAVHYEGTGDADRFAVTFDRHGHTADWHVYYHGNCDASDTEDYGAYGTPSPPGGRPLRLRHGRFPLHHHYRARYTGTIINVRFAGRLGRKAGSGTFSMRTTNDGDGGPVIHCHTGR